jgi:hypothetical protein
MHHCAAEVTGCVWKIEEVLGQHYAVGQAKNAALALLWDIIE